MQEYILLALTILQIAANGSRKSLYARSLDRFTMAARQLQVLTDSMPLRKGLPSSSGFSAFVTATTQHLVQCMYFPSSSS